MAPLNIRDCNLRPSAETDKAEYKEGETEKILEWFLDEELPTERSVIDERREDGFFQQMD